MKRLFAALMVALVPLTACMSTPEPCTQEWVDYKSNQILRSFASENRGIINDLRHLTNEDGEVNTFAAMQLMANTEDLKHFAQTFQTHVIPDLEQALAECGQSEAFIPALTGFLRDEGVGEEALEWVAPIINLMQQMREDIGNPPSTL